MNEQDLFVALMLLKLGACAPKDLAANWNQSAARNAVNWPAQLEAAKLVQRATMQRAFAELEALFQRFSWNRASVFAELASTVPAARLHEFCLSVMCEVGRWSTARPGDRYRREGLAGQGGLGRVWRAHDNEMGRIVAYKELNETAVQHAELVRRFLTEARITGQLQHPNIVPVYRLEGGADGQRPFYTMRLLTGGNLLDAIRAFHAPTTEFQGGQRFMEFRRLIANFSLACNAVAYAHSQQVIHRDIKPANIGLGSFGEVILLDWGLAKRIGVPNLAPHAPESTQEGDAENMLTREGRAAGTPGYMAPEQANGENQRLGPAADIYALGATLYTILTGQPPHQRLDHETPGAVIARSLATSPPDPMELAPESPTALNAICKKAMARLPEDRFESATEMQQEVVRWLAGEPVHCYREPWPQRLRRWIMRHRPLTFGIAATFFAISLVAGVITSAAIAQLHGSVALEVQDLANEAESFEHNLAVRVRNITGDMDLVTSLNLPRDIAAALQNPGAANLKFVLERGEKIYRSALAHHLHILEVGFATIADPPISISGMVRENDGAYRKIDGDRIVLPALKEFITSIRTKDSVQFSDPDFLLQRRGGQPAGSAILFAGKPVRSATGEVVSIGYIVFSFLGLSDAQSEDASPDTHAALANDHGQPLSGTAIDDGHPGHIDGAHDIVTTFPELASFFDSSERKQIIEVVRRPSGPIVVACRRISSTTFPAPKPIVLVMTRTLEPVIQQSFTIMYRLAAAGSAMLLLAVVLMGWLTQVVFRPDQTYPTNYQSSKPA